MKAVVSQALGDRATHREQDRPLKQSDIVALRASLQDEIRSIKKDTESEFRHLIDNVAQDLARLGVVVEKNRKEAQSARSKLEDELNHLIESKADEASEALAETNGAIRQDLANDLAALEERRRAELQRAEEALTARMDRDFPQLAAQICAAMQVRYLSLSVLLRQDRQNNHRRSEEILTELRAQGVAVRAEAATALAQAVAQQRADDELRDERTLRRCEEVDRHLVELDRAHEDRAGIGEQAHAVFRDETEKQLARLRVEVARDIGIMDTTTKEIRTIISEVENINTRRVTWRIKDVLSKAPVASPGAPEASAQSLFSPRFEAAGAHGLRMELRFHPEGLPAEAGAVPRKVPQGPGGCACSLFLWAENGLSLVFKLHAGKKAVQMEHAFDDSAPPGAMHLCILGEEVDADGSLNLGFEILEAVREVENPVLLRVEDRHDPEETGPRVEEDGQLFSSRYLNHRIMDLVRSQVAGMRSQMVRRIEWRVENASHLQRCVPEGEPVCSTSFSAAGVDGLQLIFYPNGYDGARDGFCSCFLHCPPGATLRCWLSVGKQRREARATVEDNLGFFGRTNFCRFDGVVEPDDSILVALEIEEAHLQEESEPMQLKLRPGSANLPALRQVQGSPARQDPQGYPAPGETPRCEADDQIRPSTVESSMKVHRASGRGPAMPEHVHQLPSIWTPRPLGNVQDALEGFHTFGDVQRKKSGPRKQPAPACGAAARGCSKGMPALVGDNRYTMYAAS